MVPADRVRGDVRFRPTRTAIGAAFPSWGGDRVRRWLHRPDLLPAAHLLPWPDPLGEVGDLGNSDHHVLHGPRRLALQDRRFVGLGSARSSLRASSSLASPLALLLGASARQRCASWTCRVSASRSGEVGRGRRWTADLAVAARRCCVVAVSARLRIENASAEISARTMIATSTIVKIPPASTPAIAGTAGHDQDQVGPQELIDTRLRGEQTVSGRPGADGSRGALSADWRLCPDRRLSQCRPHLSHRLDRLVLPAAIRCR